MDSRITEVQVSLHDDTVSVVSPKEITSRDIAKVLDKEGFDVIVTDVSEDPEESHHGSSSIWLPSRIRYWQKSRAHLEKCDQCRISKASSESSRSSLKKALHYFEKEKDITDGSSVIHEEDEDMVVVMDASSDATQFRAIYSIGDMTCAACTTAISTTVKEQMPELLDIGVDLINKSAVALVPNKQVALKIQEIINDIGYTCELVELTPVESNKSWRLTASISGMSCMSCVNAIKDQVGPLPYLQEADISLLTNSGTFTINDLKMADELKEKIQDMGYDYDLIEVNEVDYAKNKTSRTVNLSIKGMFCE
ncbi:hypothetical protein AWJ20_3813 [Sugiyamaella lignohabitans]|uniref:HMA domain-containing protein n=1 Tax=Sugiyamaella lignohabitans TaxID=796027 RepID=A0A161HGN9_9ASCO|nr:uncharacterized protein AWJ20_3813 [Sugiyamaella lignohabitans]ANB11017.1 hypothetical protein AWJ20_3813 [Sugiyamaella lignohabitans]